MEALQNVIEVMFIIARRYRTEALRYGSVTENIDFAHH